MPDLRAVFFTVIQQEKCWNPLPVHSGPALDTGGSGIFFCHNSPIFMKN